MEKRENKKFVSIVRDKKGSYVFRGVGTEKSILKNIEVLKKRGVDERNISILPVRADSGKCGMLLGLVALVLSGVCIHYYRKTRKKRESGK